MCAKEPVRFLPVAIPDVYLPRTTHKRTGAANPRFFRMFSLFASFFLLFLWTMLKTFLYKYFAVNMFFCVLKIYKIKNG